MMGICKTLILVVIAGWLIFPSQLLAAEPSSPPPVEAEVNAVEAELVEAEEVDRTKADELEAKIAELENDITTLEAKLEATNVKAVASQNLTKDQKNLESPDHRSPSRMVSGLGQSIAGLLGGFVFAVAGGVVSQSVCDDNCALVGGPVIGFAIGTPLTAWKIGEWLGWDGSLLATLAGSAIVATVTLLSVGNGSSLALVLISPITVPVSSTIGYHLSADWPTSSEAVAMPRATSIPLVYFDF